MYQFDARCTGTMHKDIVLRPRPSTMISKGDVSTAYCLIRLIVIKECQSPRSIPAWFYLSIVYARGISHIRGRPRASTNGRIETPKLGTILHHRLKRSSFLMQTLLRKSIGVLYNDAYTTCVKDKWFSGVVPNAPIKPAPWKALAV